MKAYQYTYNQLIDMFGFSIIKDMEYYFKHYNKRTVYKVNKHVKIRKYYNNFVVYN